MPLGQQMIPLLLHRHHSSKSIADGYRKVISQFPVYGDPPPGMQEVPQALVFKQFRELNSIGDASTFKAFPYSYRRF